METKQSDWQCCSWRFHANDEAEVETGGLSEAGDGDLREESPVLRKITMLSCDHWTLVQLTVFKVCFHLRIGLV